MPPWTPDLVAERLIDAFRRVPHCPVMSSARGFSMGGLAVEAFGWPERFVADRRDRGMLMTWARCRATGEHLKPLCRELGWKVDRVEYRRRVALGAIARGLNDHASSRTGLTIPTVAPEPVA